MTAWYMGRSDVDIYAFDHSVQRKESTVRIRTEESDIQGFLKVLLHLGARVEVFSRHDWNEDGTPQTTDDETAQAQDEAPAAQDETPPAEAVS